MRLARTSIHVGPLVDEQQTMGIVERNKQHVEERTINKLNGVLANIYRNGKTQGSALAALVHMPWVSLMVPMVQYY